MLRVRATATTSYGILRNPGRLRKATSSRKSALDGCKTPVGEASVPLISHLHAD